MAAKVDKLNIFLSNLAVINVKIHNLHWNVVGPNFFVVHKMTEKLYQMFQLQYDQVAEMMKMQNQMPLVTMAEYLDNTTIEEIEGRDYTDLEVLELLETDCQNIMALAKDIRDEADKRIISCSPTCWKNISQFMPKIVDAACHAGRRSGNGR